MSHQKKTISSRTKKVFFNWNLFLEHSTERKTSKAQLIFSLYSNKRTYENMNFKQAYITPQKNKKIAI